MAEKELIVYGKIELYQRIRNNNRIIRRLLVTNEPGNIIENYGRFHETKADSQKCIELIRARMLNGLSPGDKAVIQTAEALHEKTDKIFTGLLRPRRG